MNKYLAAVAAVGLIGCARPCSITEHPTIYIDDSFTGDESLEVERALRQWETAGLGIHFTREYVSHDYVQQLATEGALNSIFIVRVERSLDPTCPAQTPDGPGLRPGILATEWHDRGLICVNAAALMQGDGDLDGPPLLRSSIAHEIGHAFLLEHDYTDVGSVMHYLGDAFQTRITCVDARQFASVWSKPVHAGCAEGSDPIDQIDSL